MKRIFLITTAFILLFFAGCGQFDPDITSDIEIPLSVEYSLKENTVSFNLDEESDVWFVFTNTSGHSVSNPISVKEQNKNNSTCNNEIGIKEFIEDRYTYTGNVIQSKALQSDSTYFYYRGENNTWKSSPATCLYSSEMIETANGERKVCVYADNNVITSGCITEDKAKEFGETLLYEGKNNDLYDILTYWFGQEWTSKGLPGYIDSTDEITIYITDIDDDGELQAGQVYTYGYFSPADLMTIPLSNQRLMITIDSYVCKSNYKSALSTIAHEFQHAIHYNYSQSLTSEAESINEMFSSVAEQLVSRFLEVPGPEYVDCQTGITKEPSAEYYTTYSINGRIPKLLDSFNDSLLKWEGEQEDYSTVFSFGSYLLRNYSIKGDRILFREYLENAGASSTYSSLFALINDIFGQEYSKADYLRLWGVANLLSDNTDIVAPYRMNAGGVIELENPDSTEINSINLFAYYRKSDYNTAKANGAEKFEDVYEYYTPGIHSSTDETFNDSTNNYYHLGEMSVGTHTFEFDNPIDGLVLTIIAK